MYRATGHDKVFKNYYPDPSDANAHIAYYEREELTNRSWDAYRNIPLARGIIDKFATSVVGSGLTHHSNVDKEVLGLTDEEKLQKDKEIDLIINNHIQTKECDYYRVSNFYQLQRQAIISKMVDGSVLGLLSERERDGETFLTIKNIEGIQLSNKNNAVDTHELQGGVKFGKNGIEEYHILKRHPNSSYNLGQKWIVIPAYTGIRQNVLHYYDKERSGQRSGVTILASILENLMQMDKMTEAKLTRAVLASMLAIVFHKNDNKGLEEEGIQFDENGNEIFVPSDHISEDKKDVLWKAGMIYQADSDEGTPTLIDPRPDETYKDFIDVLLNEIGSAVGMPKSVMVNEFRANYTASRGELLEFWKTIRYIRSGLNSDYNQPYKEAILLHAVANGKIQLDGFLTDRNKRRAWCRSRWEGQPMGMIDMVKEIKAYKMAKDEGFMTGTTVSKNIDGSSYDENLDVAIRESVKEKKLFDERSKMTKVTK